MMRFCLMDPRPFTWDRLVWMNRQWKGIAFMDFREEKAPHFILNLIEELQREGIVESIAPCQTFAKSFLMVSPATKRKDLVLLLRPLDEDNLSKLEQWRSDQGEQVIMSLEDYVRQYKAEFTGIEQPEKTDDGSDSKNASKSDNASKKSKKGKKRNEPSPEGTTTPDDGDSEVANGTGDS